MNANKQTTTAQPAAKQPAAANAEPMSTPFQMLGQRLGNANLARVLQAKLTVSDPQDTLELEADRVADQVMRMPEAAARSPLSIQRKCEKCEEDVQRSEDS